MARKQSSPRASKLAAQFLRMTIAERIAYMNTRPDLTAKVIGTLAASVVSQDERKGK